ncbi:2-dehydro-3-deoxygluconokinase [Rhizobium rhizosphaerae]|uniref:2-dehydro-3-deoxygluconokinase n=1 Tax=Xaviernesmea rhizosphaerae TaxID=1672749 RepID=A0A1Q9AP93_9HYPH|nr:sugar kinase [Xaviernesmea rhizosphaerae]OLP57247.1 2-dehydro-3-deoxygluconokinase [Xaviernesmea rhizosphaerae]
MTRLLSIGECMVELGQAGEGLLRKGFAGDTFNLAYYARLCGGDRLAVCYCTAVGTDRLSDEMIAFIAAQGIGTEAIARIDGRMPGLYMIHLDKGERSFSYWRNASAARLLAQDGDRLRRAIEAADILAFSGITLAILPPEDVETLLSELRRAKAMGKIVAFDPNIRPRLWDEAARMRETITAGARAATLLLPSFYDEASHFGDADIAATIARYQALGVATIVVKDGGAGVTLAEAGHLPRHVPATPVGQVVDTTSAGDSFNGAFLARLAGGATLDEAAAFAAKIAASVIGHPGALIPREALGI